jgi:hypothetical protein
MNESIIKLIKYIADTYGLTVTQCGWWVVIIVGVILTSYISAKIVSSYLFAQREIRRLKIDREISDNAMKIDIRILQEELTASNNLAAALEKHVELINRNYQLSESTLRTLKTKLESDTQYKNDVYTAVVNFYQTIHSLLWRGSLSFVIKDLLEHSHLVQTSDNTQLAVDNLYKIKELVSVLDSELCGILMGVPGHLDQLTNSLMKSDEFVEVSVLVPTADVNNLHRYTYELRQVYEENKPLPLTEEV